MCRLYGFSATAPTRLDCSLVSAQNALQVQSDRDGRGRRNADGWGLARWKEPEPQIVRSTLPAFADREFVHEAEATRSRVALAHVRAATVGDVALENVHPFSHGPWAFAHNGTLTAHQELAPVLTEWTHRGPQGSTDSELIFQWLLGRMPAFGLDPNEPAPDTATLARFLKEVVLDLVRSSIAIPGIAPPKLNLLLSDGVNLAASRWGNSLYWTTRSRVPDCAVCGSDHCPEADDSYRAVAIASEPITDEPWTEVQEGTILAVGPGAELTMLDLLTRAA
jgi:glutamine amidotransferase